MKPEFIPLPTNRKVCAKCGNAYGANQQVCSHCNLPQSKPEYIAGLITTFIGIIALYFIFQL